MKLILTFLLLVCVSVPESGMARNVDMREIMTEAGRLGLKKLKFFENGVYGKLNESVFYITTREIAPDMDRLYWLMVKVLSKKYGCFIRSKIERSGKYHFFCNDSRVVIMKPALGEKVVLFQSIQKNRHGETLWVDDHRVRSTGGSPSH